MFFKRDAYKTKAFKDPSSHFMFFLKRTGTEKLNFSVIDVTYNNYNWHRIILENMPVEVV